jgi:hypothetical protein
MASQGKDSRPSGHYRAGLTTKRARKEANDLVALNKRLIDRSNIELEIAGRKGRVYHIVSGWCIHFKSASYKEREFFKGRLETGAEVAAELWRFGANLTSDSEVDPTDHYYSELSLEFPCVYFPAIPTETPPQFGPQEPTADPRIYNRRGKGGEYPPLSGFFEPEKEIPAVCAVCQDAPAIDAGVSSEGLPVCADHATAQSHIKATVLANLKTKTYKRRGNTDNGGASKRGHVKLGYGFWACVNPKSVIIVYHGDQDTSVRVGELGLTLLWHLDIDFRGRVRGFISDLGLGTETKQEEDLPF